MSRVRHDQRGYVGSSMSDRAAAAYEEGKTSWGKLPAATRRGLRASEAEAMHFYVEWHHTSKFAKVTPFYWPEAVEAFWSELGEMPTAELRKYLALRWRIGGNKGEQKFVAERRERVSRAIDAARSVNERMEGEW